MEPPNHDTVPDRCGSAGLDWSHGHAVYAAAAEATEGQVLTATPEAYDGTGVWAVDIGKP
ncbi:hypothetical protein ACIP3A_04865 [Streptomyces tricolor]|uniref:hypothetical protein n=1 Tax=Streptomyces tricolor TaxID=68277 RepID=UPI003811A340